MSPYDRVMARLAEQDKEGTESRERALHDRYALVQLSPRRWAVIKHNGHVIIGGPARDFIKWELASKPATETEALEALAKLRSEQ